MHRTAFAVPADIAMQHPNAKPNPPKGRELDLTEGKSGTSDTGHLSDPSQDRGCPCGRSHPEHRVRRETEKVVWDQMTTRNNAATAHANGKLEFVDGRTLIHFEQNCERPIWMDGLVRGVVRPDEEGRLVTYIVRCRQCASCLLAKMRYWIAAGVHQTMLTHEARRRTWFGTLTFRHEVQQQLLDVAQRKWSESVNASSAFPQWWEDQQCDYRFALVRNEVVAELQKYWKRLRKAGHKFTYFVAIERHKSGLPHVHWLLHESAGPIRKRHLQDKWPLGFTQIKLVGGNSQNAPAPERVAAYVAKYLSKSRQARQIASQGYIPAKR